ncbi:MAG: aminoglycoside phosphotransferase family protein [Candidatus Heimdallarchaeota archaeon]|nr:aminoglycoside phosphotransferase family protein [Candidatus Heimdallarchaeota archaeon]MCK5049070.1 aminoglycoside phosphotransferase family protein [Candidatus Heimdallarchaeota archaeon]
MKSLVINLLERIYEKPITQLEKKEGGVVNLVYSFVVDDEKKIIKILTRKPNDEFERFRFKKVQEILKKVKKETDIAIPEIHFLETEESEVGLSYLVMEQFHGEVLENSWTELAILEKKAILNQFGQIAGKIHSVKMDHYGEILQLSKNKHFKTWKEWIYNEINLSITSLEEDKSISREVLQKARHFSEQHIDVISNVYPQLIHGDLNFTNLFISRKSEINIQGIIDWEWCFVGSSRFEYHDIIETLEELEQKDKKENFYVESFLETYPTELKPDPTIWPLEKRLYTITKRLSCAAFGYVHHNPSPEYTEWIEKDVLKAITD